MSKMFKSIDKTWNPVTGCLHGCSYCWARKLIEGRLALTPKYKEVGFAPHIHAEELVKPPKFLPGQRVFVSPMGDLFGEWVPLTWSNRVFDVVERYPATEFLFLTKNPKRYLDLCCVPKNAILGCTIETNRTVEILRGQVWPPCSTTERLEIMADERLSKYRRFISIEPVMDFDEGRFVRRLIDIRPELIEIGADNYGCNLPEPTWHKVFDLVTRLHDAGIDVNQKQSLLRLPPHVSVPDLEDLEEVQP